MLGDGSVKVHICKSGNKFVATHQTRISNMDFECVDRVCLEINSFFGEDYQIHPYTNPNGTKMYRLAINDEIVYRLFHYFVKEKLVVADEVFRADREARVNFAAGLFDTDGYVAEQNHPGAKFGVSWRVGFASRHRTFVEDVARLLQKLGVKVGKVHEQRSQYDTAIFVIKPNIRSFIDAGCYFHILRKAKRIQHYVDAMKPSETIMPSP